MFAFELTYADEISPPSIVVVRRSLVRVGTESNSHVTIGSSAEGAFELEVRRGLGRSFRIVGLTGAVPEGIEGLYSDIVQLRLPGVLVRVLALESDLSLRDGDAGMQGELRVLRRALRGPTVRFPALQVAGPSGVVHSFSPDQTVVVGRSRPSMLRIDSPEISGRHARFGFDGSDLWVEDLGSTNGTFVNGTQVAGRATVAAGDSVLLGRTVSVVGLLSEDDLVRSTRHDGLSLPLMEAPTGAEYPVLIAGSPAARPARFVLKPGLTVQLGRDPGSDIWVGAPQVSRKHCTLFLRPEGTVVLTDHSTNGTQYQGGGMLRRGESLEVDGKMRVLDFGGGVTVAICFAQEQEQQFLSERSGGLLIQEATPEGARAERTRALTQVRIPVDDPERGTVRRGGFGTLAETELDGHGEPSDQLATMLLYAVTGVGAMAIIVIVAVLVQPLLG